MLLLFNRYRSDDDVDSEVEEALYSQVHYASSLLVSENSTPGINALHSMLPSRMTSSYNYNNNSNNQRLGSVGEVN